MFEVLATAGDTHLGGEDFDNRVIEYFTKQYKTKTGTDVSKNLRAMGKLKREVEKAKRTLSASTSVKVEIEAFENGNDFSEVGHVLLRETAATLQYFVAALRVLKPIRICFLQTLTRAKFEELNIDLFRKTMKPVEQVLKDAGVKKEDVDDVSPFPDT